jgi:hypothetical protein
LNISLYVRHGALEPEGGRKKNANKRQNQIY